jgi:hypothetical protein
MQAKHTVLLLIVAGLAAAAVVADRLLRASSSPTLEPETEYLDGSPPRGTRSIEVDTASAFESALTRAEGRAIEGRILIANAAIDRLRLGDVLAASVSMHTTSTVHR